MYLKYNKKFQVIKKERRVNILIVLHIREIKMMNNLKIYELNYVRDTLTETKMNHFTNQVGKTKFQILPSVSSYKEQRFLVHCLWENKLV